MPWWLDLFIGQLEHSQNRWGDNWGSIGDSGHNTRWDDTQIVMPCDFWLHLFCFLLKPSRFGLENTSESSRLIHSFRWKTSTVVLDGFLLLVDDLFHLFWSVFSMPIRHGKTTSTAKWLESSAHWAWGSLELTIGDYLGQFGFGVASATVVTLRLLRFTQIRIHDCMTSANLLHLTKGESDLKHESSKYGH